MKLNILLGVAVVAVSGCSSLDNPCNDQGVGQCASVTSAYDNSLKNTVNAADLPRGQSVTSANGSSSNNNAGNDLVKAYNSQQAYSQIPQAGDALRSTPKTIRVWILPYEDDVGLYHDQQYIYALVERGSWKYKSMSLKSTSNAYTNTYAGNATSSSNYSPFKAKESDSISANPALISSLGNAGGSPFSAQAVSNKNTAILNSVSTSSTTSGN